MAFFQNSVSICKYHNALAFPALTLQKKRHEFRPIFNSKGSIRHLQFNK